MSRKRPAAALATGALVLAAALVIWVSRRQSQTAPGDQRTSISEQSQAPILRPPRQRTSGVDQVTRATFRVVDALARTPLPGARADAYPEARSDAAGVLVIEVDRRAEARALRFCVSREGYAAASVELDVPGATLAVTAPEIALRPRVVYHGRAVHADGTGVRAAKVRLVHLGSDATGVPRDVLAQSVSADDGSFAVEVDGDRWLVDAGRLLLEARSGDGHFGLRYDPHPARPNDIEMAAPTGTILLEADAWPPELPERHVAFRVESELIAGGRGLSVRWRSDVLHLEGAEPTRVPVRPGRYHVYAVGPDGSRIPYSPARPVAWFQKTRAYVEAGKTATVTVRPALRKPAPHRIEVLVVGGSEGVPVPGARVLLGSWQGWTDVHGCYVRSFHPQDVPRGLVNCEVDHPEFELKTFTMPIAPTHAPLRVTLRRSACRGVLLRVTDASGAPRRDAVCQAQDASGAPRGLGWERYPNRLIPSTPNATHLLRLPRARSPASGSTPLDQLFARIRIRTPGCTDAFVSVDAAKRARAANRPVDVGIHEGHDVLLRVTEATTGEPVSHARVSVWSGALAGWLRAPRHLEVAISTRTDATGRAHLILPDTSGTLWVRHPVRGGAIARFDDARDTIEIAVGWVHIKGRALGAPGPGVSTRLLVTPQAVPEALARQLVPRALLDSGGGFDLRLPRHEGWRIEGAVGRTWVAVDVPGAKDVEDVVLDLRSR